MRKLTPDIRASILTALVEGDSVNSTARVCDSRKTTVLWLLADAGTIAAAWHGEHVRDLHFWHYNWSRRHQTLKTTPAVAAGIATRRMQIVELVEHLEAQEAVLGGQVTDYLPSPDSGKNQSPNTGS